MAAMESVATVAATVSVAKRKRGGDSLDFYSFYLVIFFYDKSPFGGGNDRTNKKVSMLLSTSVKRFFVSCMRYFFF